MKFDFLKSFLFSGVVFTLLHYSFFVIFPRLDPDWRKSVIFGLIMGIAFTLILRLNKKPGSKDPGS